MNYYKARQRQSDLVWHYTCQNDNNIWPVGYCAQGCAGHRTKEEAAQHFRAYILDNFSFDGQSSDQQRKCEVCQAWTDRIAQGGIGNTDIHSLCDEHATRDWLATVLPDHGDTSKW